MSAEDNKAIARRYWDEGWGTGNVAMVDEIFAPDNSFHPPHRTTALRGTEPEKQGITRWRTAIPDLRGTIEDIFAEGDKVVVRWTLRGTHRGNIEIASVGTIPPTGKHVSIAGMDIYHFRGGKMVERWRYWNELQLLQQVGAVPTAG